MSSFETWPPRTDRPDRRARRVARHSWHCPRTGIHQPAAGWPGASADLRHRGLRSRQGARAGRGALQWPDQRPLAACRARHQRRPRRHRDRPDRRPDEAPSRRHPHRALHPARPGPADHLQSRPRTLTDTLLIALVRSSQKCDHQEVTEVELHDEVAAWLDTLSDREWQRVVVIVDRLADLGHEARMPLPAASETHCSSCGSPSAPPHDASPTASPRTAGSSC